MTRADALSPGGGTPAVPEFDGAGLSSEHQRPFRLVGRHLPALDGVRGIAIALVFVVHFISHGRFETGSSVDNVFRLIGGHGWIGVDLFFVLSGFLITGILLETKRDPRYFRVFYARRFLRIFPLYYGFLIAWFVALPLVAHVRLAEVPAGEQAWYWTYLFNVRIAMDGWPDTGFLAHFWTLAIEEQFYLVWPLVVYKTSARTLRRICWGLIALAPLLRMALVSRGEIFAALVLTPARADVLAAGALLAVLMHEGLDRSRAARLGWACLAAGGLPIAAVMLASRRLVQTGGATLSVGLSAVVVACCGAVLLAASAREGSRVHRVLTAPFLVLLGKLSYGLYVFHQPVMLGVTTYGFSIKTMPLLLGSQIFGLFVYGLTTFTLSFALAYASWHLFEKRILALKTRFRYEPAADTASTADLRETARPAA